jgi:5-methylcytosine-specific restriction endonuclease McrA
MCLTIDHILPHSKGGTDRWRNLRPAHQLCTLRHGNIEDTFDS